MIKEREKEDYDVQQEDIFEKTKDVIIILESTCYSELSYR